MLKLGSDRREVIPDRVRGRSQVMQAPSIRVVSCAIPDMVDAVPEDHRDATNRQDEGNPQCHWSRNKSPSRNHCVDAKLYGGLPDDTLFPDDCARRFVKLRGNLGQLPLEGGTVGKQLIVGKLLCPDVP